MTPGARIQTAIELLERIEAPNSGKEGIPADTVLSGYFRGRRYIGAKDRRAIAGLVYQVLRHRGALDWRLQKFAEAAPAPPVSPTRGRVIAALRHLCKWPVDDIAAAFDGGQYRPPPLSSPERALLEPKSPTDPEEAPLWVRTGVPAWLEADLVERYGADVEAELNALNQVAPVDLRVNTLKGDRGAVLDVLEADGLAPTPTPISPLGIRLERRTPRLAAVRDGRVEVQDESSQLAALLTGAGPGMDVLDLCAGAGGKTLALAAIMANRGRIVAADTDRKRLQRMTPRLARAGVTIVEPSVLGKNGDGLDGSFDRVLIDAPCSGSGAWRRNPEAKWRLSLERLDEMTDLQHKILEAGAARVARGGRLIYATCSMLPVENEIQVTRFLKLHDAFRAVPAATAWREAGLPGGPGAEPWIQLTPHRHGTDGFFVAVLERLS